MVDNGIKPVFVFDGKPPTMKVTELSCTFIVILVENIFIRPNLLTIFYG